MFFEEWSKRSLENVRSLGGTVQPPRCEALEGYLNLDGQVLDRLVKTRISYEQLRG